MKKLNLNHDLTPKELIKINSQLESVLNAELLDNELLKELVILRDKRVAALLNSLKGTDKTEFSKNELETNNQLLSHIEVHFRDTLNELSSLIKGRKSVNKYV